MDIKLVVEKLRILKKFTWRYSMDIWELKMTNFMQDLEIYFPTGTPYWHPDYHVWHYHFQNVDYVNYQTVSAWVDGSWKGMNPCVDAEHFIELQELEGVMSVIAPQYMLTHIFLYNIAFNIYCQNVKVRKVQQNEEVYLGDQREMSYQRLVEIARQHYNQQIEQGEDLGEFNAPADIPRWGELEDFPSVTERIANIQAQLSTRYAAQEEVLEVRAMNFCDDLEIYFADPNDERYCIKYRFTLISHLMNAFYDIDEVPRLQKFKVGYDYRDPHWVRVELSVGRVELSFTCFALQVSRIERSKMDEPIFSSDLLAEWINEHGYVPEQMTEDWIVEWMRGRI